MLRSRARISAALALVAAAAAGCHQPVTEIVLVVQSELAVPDEVDSLAVIITGDPGLPTETDHVLTGSAPATLGLVPSSSDVPFSVEAQGKRQGAIVVTARATGVRFVHGEKRTLTLVLRRACACVGTSCPPTSTPGCEDLVSPTLPPFDPGRLPPIYAGGSDAAADLPGDRASADVAAADVPDAPADAGTDRGAERAAADGATADASTESAADAAPEAPADAARPCSAAFGGCSPDCPTGTYCDSTSRCVPGFTVGFCQVGGCTCAAGYSCVPPDGSGAGQCLAN